MSLTRKYSDYVSEKTGPETWAGTIVFVCPEAEADAHVNALHDSVMPGAGGGYPPRAKRVKAHHNAEPGFAWLVATYITSRQPGEAKLIGRISTDAKERTIDLDGEVIVGPAADGMHWYKVTSGTNLVAEGIETIVLQTAVTDDEFDLRATRADRGSINEGYLANFGQAPAGALLFWNFEHQWKWGEGLRYLDYTFRVCPEHDESGTVLSWNDSLLVQKHVWVVKEVPVLIPDVSLPMSQWEESGKTARVRELVPGFEYQRQDGANILVPAEPEHRRCYRTADWSNLDALVRW